MPQIPTTKENEDLARLTHWVDTTSDSSWTCWAEQEAYLTAIAQKKG